MRDIRATAWVLMEVLGYRASTAYSSATNPKERTIVFEVGEGGAGKEIWVIEQPKQPAGRLGAGRLGAGGVCITSPSAPPTKKRRANGANASPPTASASPTSLTASTSAPSTSASQAASYSKSPPTAPASPPMKTPNSWANDWRFRPSWSRIVSGLRPD